MCLRNPLPRNVFVPILQVNNVWAQIHVLGSYFEPNGDCSFATTADVMDRMWWRQARSISLYLRRFRLDITPRDWTCSFPIPSTKSAAAAPQLTLTSMLRSHQSSKVRPA